MRRKIKKNIKIDISSFPRVSVSDIFVQVQLHDFVPASLLNIEDAAKLAKNIKIAIKSLTKKRSNRKKSKTKITATRKKARKQGSADKTIKVVDSTKKKKRRRKYRAFMLRGKHTTYVLGNKPRNYSIDEIKIKKPIKPKIILRKKSL